MICKVQRTTFNGYYLQGLQPFGEADVAERPQYRASVQENRAWGHIIGWLQKRGAQGDYAQTKSLPNYDSWPA